MKIAIIGSRTFPQPKLIEAFINDLPNGITIISGGAKGADEAGAYYAKIRNLELIEFLPDLSNCREQLDFTKQYYERNQKIVDNADLIVAFTERDRGGTWDTIKRAIKANKPIKIIKPSLFFPGDIAKTETQIIDNLENEKIIGQGPFAIKRVSLGSYALRRKLYISSEEWAEIIINKNNHPDLLAKQMIPAFLDFFYKNKRFGYIHAITEAPRSIRNLDKVHVMDIVCAEVANVLNIPFVKMFEPWQKTSRGRFAKHGEITITKEVKNYIGKIVYVLDDITTTNFTLKTSVQSLISLEIHAHGVAWVLMA